MLLLKSTTILYILFETIHYTTQQSNGNAAPQRTFGHIREKSNPSLPLGSKCNYSHTPTLNIRFFLSTFLCIFSSLLRQI